MDVPPIHWQTIAAAGGAAAVGAILTAQRVSGYSLKDWLAPRRAQRRERANAERDAARDAARHRMYSEGLYANALVAYYREGLAAENIGIYTVRHGAQTTAAAFATRSDWVALKVPLLDATCRTIPAPTVDFTSLRSTIPHARLEHMRSSLGEIWDDPLFRIHEIEVADGSIEATFSVDGFFNYRRNSGLMVEELESALLDRDLDVDRLNRESRVCLPIRNLIAPAGAGLVEFGKRMTQGGPAVVLAMATERGDYVIPLTRRSHLVAGNRGLRSVTFQGMHAPLTDRTDSAIIESVYRELFEELENGDSVRKTGRKLGPRWFVSESKALTWLEANPDDVTAEVVTFGVSLVNASYEFCVLLAVHNPEFYAHVAKSFTTDWESEFDEELRTSDQARISSILEETDWTPEGKVALIESLMRLAQLTGPEAVRMPSLERTPAPKGF